MSFSDSQIQMTLDLDTQLTERFRSARRALAVIAAVLVLVVA